MQGPLRALSRRSSQEIAFSTASELIDEKQPLNASGGTPIDAKMPTALRKGVNVRSRLLFLLFCLCVFSTIIRVPLLGYELWLLATEASFIELTVWALLTEHLPFLSWIADLAIAALGAELGWFILGLPATLMTIIKLIVGTLIGFWALSELDASHVSGHEAQLPS
jgi:hypothetical protein